MGKNTPQQQPKQQPATKKPQPKTTPQQQQQQQQQQREKVLVLCSRYVTTRQRHFMNDILDLLPHGKKDGKTDPKDTLRSLNEVCELRSCTSCIYLEANRRHDVFVWLGHSPHGPSVKFHLLNMHNLQEMRMTGNCLKGSRPILSFDNSFDQFPHTKLLKEMFTQIFSTPKGHPHSKPFVDHVLSFSILDSKIWFRNYQIVWPSDNRGETQLVEIGPRFVLDIVKIFEGSFGGKTLYSNPNFVTPTEIRRKFKREKLAGLAAKTVHKNESRKRKSEHISHETEIDKLFVTDRTKVDLPPKARAKHE